MKWRIAGLLTFILLFYSAIQLYIGWHAHLFMTLWTTMPSVLSTFLWVLFVLIAYGFVLAMIGRKFWPPFVFRWLRVVGSYWFVIVQYSVLILPLADLAGWLLLSYDLPRTAVIGSISSFVLACFLIIFVVGTWNAKRPVIRRHRLQIAKNGGTQKLLKIAVASDLHLGAIIGRRELKRFVRKIEAMTVDLLLLPGDVMDDDYDVFREKQMAEIFATLQLPLGAYAVLGNHEYYGGQVEAYVQQMREVARIQVLRDETKWIADSFYLVGRHDKTVDSQAKRMSVDELTDPLDKARPILMMDHQPLHLQQAADAGVDLLLCGHTHRGQLFPNHWITRRIFELDWGYLQKGQLHTLVSSGLGTWGPPLRIGSRSEILLVELEFVPS